VVEKERTIVTRSEAERRALMLMRRQGVEPDHSDYPIGRFRVDFYFAKERIAVEVDGFRYHATPDRFVHDRRRIAYLTARGIQVFPLTWEDVTDPAAGVEAIGRLQAALRARRVEFAHSTR
jgi:very-short-patch-repair endonuclease